MILHPSGVTCFRPVICDKDFKQTFAFVDVGSEKIVHQGPRDEHVTPLG
jgi:hypothetical protein